MEDEEERDERGEREDADVERFDAWVEENGLKHGIDASVRYRHREAGRL